MNKDSFSNLSSKQRVKIVNDFLIKEDFDLQKVSDYLVMKYSTFTKLMQEDDYDYIKRDNQYYKYVRDKRQLTNIPQAYDGELAYLKADYDVLQSLMEQHKDNSDFLLDKRIFRSPSKIATKTSAFQMVSSSSL